MDIFKLAQLVVNEGGVGAIVELLMNNINSDDDVIIPAATALGYIAGQSPHLALAIIESKVGNWFANFST